MPNKKYGKPSQLKREKLEQAKKPSSEVSENLESPGTKKEHPVMEDHPGSRVKDPVTGEKPKPVRKPRTRKPKAEPSGSAMDAPKTPAPSPTGTPDAGNAA